jgi:ribosomal protein L7Ae-like RNA K-turn-binding protein
MDLANNLGFIGLARKAGALEIGSDAVEAALTKGKAKLVIMTDDAGRSTITKFTLLCEAKSVPIMRASVKLELGRTLGRSQLSVIAVTKYHFAARMLK